MVCVGVRTESKNAKVQACIGEVVSVSFIYNLLGRSFRLFLSSDPVKVWTVCAAGAKRCLRH